MIEKVEGLSVLKQRDYITAENEACEILRNNGYIASGSPTKLGEAVDIFKPVRKGGTMMKKRGLTCAICGTQHYQPTTTFIDCVIDDKGKTYSWDLPFKSNNICKTCSKDFNVKEVKGGYIAERREDKNE